MMSREQDRRMLGLGWRGILVVGMWLSVPTLVLAQGAGCQLVDDDRKPSEKILRCGDDLTVRSAPSTRYELTDQNGQTLAKELPADGPHGARLQSGALLIEFKRTEKRQKFQVLTPHAIAAARGTTWAVEVEPDRTSTLVVIGYVEVTRPDGASGVVLRAGQGADVAAGRGPIQARRWATPRVRALLARFGQ